MMSTKKSDLIVGFLWLCAIFLIIGHIINTKDIGEIRIDPDSPNPILIHKSWWGLSQEQYELVYWADNHDDKAWWVKKDGKIVYRYEWEGDDMTLEEVSGH